MDSSISPSQGCVGSMDRFPGLSFMSCLAFIFLIDITYVVCRQVEQNLPVSLYNGH